MTTVPILMNHDRSRPIGFVEVDDGQLHCRFTEDVEITFDMALEIFGQAGVMALETVQAEPGKTLIRRGRLVEWSLCPAPKPAPGNLLQEAFDAMQWESHDAARPHRIKPGQAGYVCADCGAVFEAADRTAQVADLPAEWERRARGMQSTAERTEDPAGKRQLEHAAACYLNAAVELRERLNVRGNLEPTR